MYHSTRCAIQPEKSTQQKWFVVDPLHLLLAVPDKVHLHKGRLLTVAPLFSTTAHTHEQHPNRLVVRCCSDAAIGLADSVPCGDLAASQAVQAVLPGTRRAKATWWKLVIRFDKEDNCVRALQHINGRQAALRGECKANLMQVLLASPAEISYVSSSPSSSPRPRPPLVPPPPRQPKSRAPPPPPLPQE